MTVKELRAVERFLLKEQGSFERAWHRSCEMVSIGKTEPLCNLLQYNLYGRKVLRKLIADARASLKAAEERADGRTGGGEPVVVGGGDTGAL